MPTYKAKVKEYITDSGDIWDIIALRCYGDTHAMHRMMEANYDYRFMDFFPADIRLEVPQTVTIANDLRADINFPDIKRLLPWR